MPNYDYWRDLEKHANSMSKLNKGERSGVLISVVPTLPLQAGRKPRPEFVKKLDLCAKLYKELRTDNVLVAVFISGTDLYHESISASSAGANYLIDLGVSPYDICEDRYNNLIGNGVLNLHEHCETTSAIFNLLNCGELYQICNAAQVLRMSLEYSQFDVVPTFMTVPSKTNNCIREIKRINKLLGGNEDVKQNFGNAPKRIGFASSVRSSSVLYGNENFSGIYKKQS